MFKEVIVVEGKEDTRRLRELYPTVETIETNGSALSEETLQLIEKAHRLRGVIVLTDPDYAGKKIRSLIQERLPDVQHAFLRQQDAQSRKAGESLGVEHASKEAIEQALASVRKTTFVHNEISQADLIKWGLLGHAYSAQLRKQLNEQLRIGHTNGKQLLKRLNLFGVSKDEVEQALRLLKEKG